MLFRSKRCAVWVHESLVLRLFLSDFPRHPLQPLTSVNGGVHYYHLLPVLESTSVVVGSVRVTRPRQLSFMACDGARDHEANGV